MEEVIITNQSGESITLGNRAPYFLQTIDGVGEVGVNIESQKAPRQDGSTYIDNTLGNRAITIQGMIVTKDNPTAVKEARRKMQSTQPKTGQVVITYQGRKSKVLWKQPLSSQRQEQRNLLSKIFNKPALPPTFWLDTYYESREMSYLMGGCSLSYPYPLAFLVEGLDEAIKG